MDLAAMVTLLVMALALATQPYSVLAGIILVATAGGQAKLAAYLVGWAAALSAVMVATVAIAPNTGGTSSGSAVPPTAEVVLGLAFAAILAVLWRRSKATPSEAPAWLRRLEAVPWLLALPQPASRSS